MLMHIYLEQYSYQEHQQEIHYWNRIKGYIADKHKCLEDFAWYKQKTDDELPTEFPEKSCNEQKIPKKELEKILKQDTESLIKDYSKKELLMKLTENTLNDTKFQSRHIPLLGIDVPANDFITLMSIISFVFVIGLWLNLRGISDSVQALTKHNDQKLIELARINTVFLTRLETSQGQLLSKIIRATGIYLPFLSLLIAIIFGFSDAILPFKTEENLKADENFGPDEYIWGNFIFQLIMLALHIWVAVECKFVLKDINAMFNRTDQIINNEIS